MANKKKSDEEWKTQLNEESFYVTRHSGTERPFTGKYWNFTEPLLNDRANSIEYIRKVMVRAHPDKNPAHRTAATAYTQGLNFLTDEPRKPL